MTKDKIIKISKCAECPCLMYEGTWDYYLCTITNTQSDTYDHGGGADIDWENILKKDCPFNECDRIVIEANK